MALGETRPAGPLTQLPPLMAAVTRRDYGGPDQVAVENLPIPRPGPKEISIQVEAAGLDRAVLHLLHGLPSLMRLAFGIRRPRQPILGGEVVGTVVEVGAEVHGLAVGQRVAGEAQGTFAEFALARPQSVAAVPPSVSTIAAATVGVSGVTAWGALREQGQVRAGERVLILGASGGVGSFAVQLAALAGAHVTAVCSLAKAAFVSELGADVVADYATTALSDFDEPFDVVIDIAGNRPLREVRSALSREGRLVIVGGERGGRLLGGQQRNLGAVVLNPFTSQTLTSLFSQTTTERLTKVLALMATGELRAPIDHTAPFEAAADALRAMESGHLRGKVVLIPKAAG